MLVRTCTYTLVQHTHTQPQGGGATGYQEWFDYVGLVKDKRTPPIGSPYQLNFPSGAIVMRVVFDEGGL